MAARACAQLGIDVVCDFRSADVAAGGEGAPLIPLYHAAIAAGLEKPLMLLNWGGVGNVTYLGADGEILAFDTGPANALDRRFYSRPTWGSRSTRAAGWRQAARRMTISSARFLKHAYFERPAPKSLDRNQFHAALPRPSPSSPTPTAPRRSPPSRSRRRRRRLLMFPNRRAAGSSAAAAARTRR